MDSSVLASKLEQIKTLIEECLGSLDHARSPQSQAISTEHTDRETLEIDFDRPIRPFMKGFVALSGSRKFVLLLAWLAKGDLEKQIPLSEVQSQWDSMTGMLKAKFNRKFSSEAKDFDWIDSRKTGMYNLRPNWKQALKGSGA